MPRIRTIKPELWTDSKVVRLSLEARLLFIGSWNFADDFGCLPPDPFELKLRVLPMEHIDTDAVIDELFHSGLFEHLRAEDGRDFWHITNWSKHQRINRPTPSEYGHPTTWGTALTRGFSEDSVRTHGALTEYSLSTHGGLTGERKGTEGNGTERKDAPRERSLSPAASQREPDPIWDALVELYGAPTPSQKTLYGRVRKFLEAAGATPEEIQRRTALIVKEWGGTRYATISSLEKYWNRFDGQLAQITDDQIRTFTRKQRQQAELAAAQAMRGEAS